MKKCFFCGNINLDSDEFCDRCGRELGMNSQDNKRCDFEFKKSNHHLSSANKYRKVCCPICHSDRLQATVETSTSVKTKGKNYSAGKGFLGWLLFSTPGFLLGSVGQKQRTYVNTQNRNFWVCTDCGNKFRNTDDWNTEIAKKQRGQLLKIFFNLIIGILGLLLFLREDFLRILGFIIIVIAGVRIISSIISILLIKIEKRKLTELERVSKSF